jgi:hypothetical protein
MRPLIAALIVLATIATCEAQTVTKPKVGYTAAVCQPGTATKLTTVAVGQTFDLVLYVRDLRPAGTWVDYRGTTQMKVRGVFAAFCDVHYDKALAAPAYFSTETDTVKYLDCFTFTPRYPNGKMAADSDKGINDAGAFSSYFSGTQQTVEVWRVRMTAKAAGALLFTPDVKDIPQPICATLVYGNTAAKPPEQSLVTPAEIVCIPYAVTVSN